MESARMKLAQRQRVRIILSSTRGSSFFTIVLLLTILVLTILATTPVLAVNYQIRGGIVTFGGTSSEDYTVSSGGQGGGVPPTISSVASTDATEDGAKITWTTDVNSDSFVEYGTTTDYGFTQGINDSVTSHAVTLIGLQYSTSYHYRACSRNSASTRTCSSDKTLTTTALGTSAKGAPTVSGVSATAKIGVVTIEWTTDTESDSFVDYGLTKVYTNAQGLVEAKTSHKVLLRGLVPGTTYHYRVRSTDKRGRVGYSADATFSTASTALSGISGVEIVEIGLDYAVVTWSTGSVTTTAIHYGETQEYGLVVKDESLAKTTLHTLRLTGLLPGTRYHFQIRGTDASGETFTSDDYVFETINLPVIDNIAVDVGNDGKAHVSWTTNIPADSIVVYGRTTDYGLSTGSGDLTTDHRVTISGLEDDKDYQFKVTSRDEYGNRAESENRTFHTLKDEVAPIITEVLTEASPLGSGETAQVQLIVSWTTDEPSTSQVEYGIGVGGEAYESATVEDPNLNASHLMIISGLEPATAYHYRVISKDRAGNEAVSDDFTVITPPREESVLQLVIQSWEETFAWIPKLKEFMPF